MAKKFKNRMIILRERGNVGDLALSYLFHAVRNETKAICIELLLDAPLPIL